MTASIHLYPLGVGDSGATKFWHTSFLLVVEGHRYVIDCPRHLFQMLAFNQAQGALPVSLLDYQNILLTHLHFDHAEGLVELAHARHISEDKPLNLYAPGQTLDYLWSHHSESGIISAADVPGGSA